MSSVVYTEATTLVSKVTTELNSLADNGAALIATELSNDASTERQLLANFALTVATQGGARDGGNFSLIIVPAGVGTVYADVAASYLIAKNYIARREDGTLVTWATDAATTAREFTAAGVKIPNSNYKIGVINESGYALAASGNILYASGNYGTTYA